MQSEIMSRNSISIQVIQIFIISMQQNQDTKFQPFIMSYQNTFSLSRYFSIKQKMEELTSNNTQLNPKAYIQTPTAGTHTFYAYSSRFIPMPQKQKVLDASTDQAPSVNEPIYKEAKQRIQTEYDDLTEYISQLQDKFLELNQNQLNSLSDKHRYFLRKFKKYLQENKKLSETYQNLDNIVMENPSVQEEIKSINFIQMISMETERKLQSLKQEVSHAEEEKAENQKNIEKLKKELSDLKTEFFAKKREQLAINTLITERQKEIQFNRIESTMKRIRQEKRQKFPEMKNTFYSKTQKSAPRSNAFPNSQTQYPSTQPNFRAIDTTLTQIKNLNNKNQSFIKSLSQSCQNFKNRKLQDKKKLNSKVVSQTDLQNFRIKSRQQARYRKSEEQELLKNQQIIKQLSITNRMRDQFQKKKPQEILDILIKGKKLKDLLGIIEEVKSMQSKQSTIEKRNINLIRSQMYKKSTAIVVQPQNSQSRLVR